MRRLQPYRYGRCLRKRRECRQRNPRITGRPFGLFVTGKLWNTERGYDKTIAAFEKTLQDLDTDYLDLYLIHWPASPRQYSNWREINSETWRALETLYDQGKIRAIGVSNFGVSHLEALLEDCRISPMVNQIEVHPGQNQTEIVDFCRDHDILVEAWSPLGTGRMLANPVLNEIGEAHDKSAAQVCIRWLLQRGILPLPKSVTPHRIAENIDVFDFELTDEDMNRINEIPYFGGSGLDPDKVDF